MVGHDDTIDGMLITGFRLGKASFGIDARLVQEVVKISDLTHVHQAPTGVVGIRNLRGHIVTVIDLAQHLGLGEVAAGDENRLLIIENDGESYGFLVDAVTEAIVLDEELISDPPASLDPDLRERLHGVWREADQLTSILEPQSLFRWAEVEA